MPTIEHVVTLLNAGFSADEIRAMHQTASPAAPETPAAPDVPAQPVADMTAILQRISELTAAVQANGIAHSQQPLQPDRADVLASIIMPNK